MPLGNSGVGKTSFITRFTENKFQTTYLSTVGMDFGCKIIKIKNKKYKLLFYDTLGQERFKSLAPNLIKKSNGIIIMYDITDKSSFDSIPELIKNIREEKGNDFPAILVGNKIDLEEKRKIGEEQGKNLAEEYGMEFFEISNKEGINIQEVALAIVNKIFENANNGNIIFENDNISRILDNSYLSKFSNYDDDESHISHCC